MSRDYHTRLPPDHAEGVDQYAEDHDVKKSEVLRRAVERFLTAEGYPKQDGRIVTDGGYQPVRKMLEELGTIWAVLGFAAFGVVFLLGSPLLPPIEWLGMGVSGLVLTGIVQILLHTRAPDVADDFLNQQGRRLAVRLREVTT